MVCPSPEVVMSATVTIATPPAPFERKLLLFVVIAALIVSGIAPKDRLTWLLEVVWVIIALPIIALNWGRFPLTRLLCWLLVAHALVLIHGGAYTYAETPIGFWLRDTGIALGLDIRRNPWDRVGHLMQGFVPAILARELLLRRTPLRRGGWLFYLVLAVCLSFSAFFELIEWWSALIYGADADAFLATQGDVWDTQWDMFLCLIGATLSLLLWSRLHDRQLGGRVSESDWREDKRQA
jgi:putative membrane protein